MNMLPNDKPNLAHGEKPTNKPMLNKGMYPTNKPELKRDRPTLREDCNCRGKRR